MTKARTRGQRRRERHPRETEPATEAPLIAVAPSVTPTPEARRHGRYTRGDSPGSPWVNDASTLLGKLVRSTTISRQQRIAGEAFADTWRLVWGSPGCDSTVLRVGGVAHEGDAQAASSAARRDRLKAVLKRCGPGAYAVLVQVAVFEQALGRSRGVAIPRYNALRTALDACVVEYGVPG